MRIWKSWADWRSYGARIPVFAAEIPIRIVPLALPPPVALEAMTAATSAAISSGTPQSTRFFMSRSFRSVAGCPTLRLAAARAKRPLLRLARDTSVTASQSRVVGVSDTGHVRMAGRRGERDRAARGHVPVDDSSRFLRGV